MSSETCEAALEAALQSCGNVDAFLDNFFGFLAKRTDFFVECPPEGGRFGFPPGQAESIVRSKFLRWQKYAAEKSSPLEVTAPKSVKDMKLTSDISDNGNNSSDNGISSVNVTSVVSSSKPSEGNPGVSKNEEEAYNGRVTEKYSWSQTINEVDVTIPVGKHIKKGKQMKVTIETGRVLVTETESNEPPIVDGKLTFPVKKEDCYWNLLPGECIRIWLQKSQERWWQALLDGEELLEMSQIEAVRPIEELDEEEQMKLQELCWNEERKRQGLPTSEEMKMQKVLEQAWNVDGSPFKGTPVDPSIVQFSSQNQGTFIPPSDS